AGSRPGRERRLPARRKDEPERDGAGDRSREYQRRGTHVAYGELDEEERGAPDQGQRAECKIAASHRTIMRSRDVTLLFPLPLAGRASPLYSLSRLRGRVGWRLLGDRLGAMAGQEVLRHRVHGRALLVLDLFLFDPVALVLVVDQLHRLVDFLEQMDAV